MNSFDLFDGINETALESLSQDFPVLTDEEKERIYFMSARKYNNYRNNISDTTFSAEEDVKGVERYKRPKMITASIAAAAAFIIGAGSFGGYNIAKQLSEGNGETPDVNQNVTEDIAQAQTETAEDPRTEEYRSIAESLVSEFEDFLYPYIDEELPVYPETEDVDISGMSEEEREAYAQQIDEEYSKYFDHIWFELGRGDPYDHPNYEQLGYYYYYHYETGMKYSNTDEVMEKALSFMSQFFIEKQFPDLIGEDMTNYEVDRIYDCDTEETPFFGTYAMYNGKLYCNREDHRFNNKQYISIKSAYYFYNRKDEPIVITDIEDDSFIACVKYEFTSVPNNYDMTMKVVNIDGKWIIDQIKPTGPDPDQQKLDIIDKIVNSCNYYDKISCKYSWATRADSELANGDVLPHSNVKSGILYADNTANKEYSCSDDGNDYDRELDIDSLLNNSKSADEKMGETYCDGEKYYYWVNSDEYSDGWYHWCHYTPHENTFCLDNLIIDNFHQVSNRNISHGMTLGPDGQHLVYDYLYDLSIWDITGDINFDGRDCYIIDINAPSYCIDSYNILSEYHYDSIKLYIDKETGIPMAEEYSKEGSIEKCEIYYDIRINDDAEPVPDIDMNDYDLSRFTYK